MTEQAIGYTAHHIEYALCDLGIKYKFPPRRISRSSSTISKYAKKHGLFVEYRSRLGRRLLIPERNLEKLIEALGLEVSVDDLYGALVKESS